MKNRYKPIVAAYLALNFLFPVPREKENVTLDPALPARLAKKNREIAYRAPDPAVESALARAVGFLSDAQLPSGEFSVLEATRPDFSDGKHDSSAFATSFVIHSLQCVRDARIPPMIHRALRFILENKERGRMTWRYWSKTNWKYGRLLRPDVDDTSVHLISLLQNGIRGGDDTTYVETMNEDGSIPTWMGTPLDGWPLFQATDGVVNANVWYHLELAGKTNARLETYLQNLIHDQKIASSLRYYRTPACFAYAWARAFAVKKSPHLRPPATQLRDFIAKTHPVPAPLADFDLALTSAALHYLAAPPTTIRPYVDALLARQTPDGSWGPGSFYVGPSPHYGSKELTTALACEALGLHLARL